MATPVHGKKFTNPQKMEIFQMVDYSNSDGTGELH